MYAGDECFDDDITSGFFNDDEHPLDIANEVEQDWDYEDDYFDCLLPGEDMDGDFDSGMASAGFGTDEDYGYYGGEDDF